MINQKPSNRIGNWQQAKLNHRAVIRRIRIERAIRVGAKLTIAFSTIAFLICALVF